MELGKMEDGRPEIIGLPSKEIAVTLFIGSKKLVQYQKDIQL